MCCLRLGGRGFELPAVSKKVWKKLTKSTKFLHKFIVHKSRKLMVIKRPNSIPPHPPSYNLHKNKRTKKQASLFLSPHHKHLKRKKQHHRCYYAATQKPPIYIDDLFSSTNSFPSSSTLATLRRKEGACYDHEKINEDSCSEPSSSSSSSPPMGIDERAEMFIASFRAELDRSFSKW